jgi:hypothetical protein
MPNVVCMIGAGHLEKLLKVINVLPHLALEVALDDGDELLVGIIGLLVVVVLVTDGSDCDSLGSLLRPPIVAFGALLCALASCLEWHPSTTTGGRLPIALDKNGLDCLLTRGVSGGDVEQRLWLITTELITLIF